MELVIYKVKLKIGNKIEEGYIPEFTDDPETTWKEVVKRLKDDGNILASEIMDTAQEPEFREISRKDKEI